MIIVVTNSRIRRLSIYDDFSRALHPLLTDDVAVTGHVAAIILADRLDRRGTEFQRCTSFIETSTMAMPQTQQHRHRLIAVPIIALISMHTTTAFISVSTRLCDVRITADLSPSATTSKLFIVSSVVDDAKLVIENSM
jgi:hypothetical protein